MTGTKERFILRMQGVLFLLIGIVGVGYAQIPENIDPSEDEVTHISENPTLIWVLIGVVGALILWYLITKLIKQRASE